MLVELGAGEQTANGHLAVDLNPNHADVIANTLDLPFPDGTVTALRAVDVLEHISYRDTDRALAEWARVCCAGANIYVQVPDADGIIDRYMRGVEMAVPPDLPQTQLAAMTWRLLGGHQDGNYCKPGDDFRWNSHYALFNHQSLCEALDRAGFHVDDIRTNGHPNLCCHGHRR